jgi:hypothetical protein
MVYVAARFKPSRRRDGSSWTHHAEVAALPDDEQDAWLDRAQRDRVLGPPAAGGDRARAGRRDRGFDREQRRTEGAPD